MKDKRESVELLTAVEWAYPK